VLRRDVGDAAVIVEDSGLFDLASFDQSLGTLSGDGNVRVGSDTITIGTGNLESSFDGSISGGGGLKKIGSGSLTLSGANTYQGPTMIMSGTIDVVGSNERLSDTTAVSVQSGAKFQLLENTIESIGSLSGSGRVTISSYRQFSACFR